jgi:hypothetical protein
MMKITIIGSIVSASFFIIDKELGDKKLVLRDRKFKWNNIFKSYNNNDINEHYKKPFYKIVQVVKIGCFTGYKYPQQSEKIYNGRTNNGTPMRMKEDCNLPVIGLISKEYRRKTKWLDLSDRYNFIEYINNIHDNSNYSNYIIAKIITETMNQ